MTTKESCAEGVKGSEYWAVFFETQCCRTKKSVAIKGVEFWDGEQLHCSAKHLFGSFVGEGDGQNRTRGYSGMNHVSDSLSHHSSLATARASDHHQRTRVVRDGFLLSYI